MKRLRLKHPNNLALVGQGWNLEVTFTANLERRRARDVPVAVTVTLTRPNIRCILEQVAAMHVREKLRIDGEKQTLVGGDG